MCLAGPINACWLWQGPTGWAGFGLVYLKDGSSERAHRVAYMLTTHRVLGLGEHVAQRCGQKLCVNPHHLQLGRTRGTQRGSQHGRAKLQEGDIRAIRRLSAEGQSGRELARAYAISPSTVCRILKRRIWTHVE